jgi:hypothetical protein
MSDKKHTIAEMEAVVATVGARVELWQGRFMSLAARLILTDTCLSSLPLHMMSLFMLADGTHAGFDKHRSRFFWEGTGEKCKHHWVSWSEVCMPKEQGGLGITNTKIMNIALMVKWIWRLFSEDPNSSLWHQINRAKYPGLGIFSTLRLVEDPLSGIAYIRLKSSFSWGQISAWQWGMDPFLD